MPAPLQSVTVLAPAKLNLSLDVVGLLPGGYHALDMVMQAVPATPPTRRRWPFSTTPACWPGPTSPCAKTPPSGPGWGAARPTPPPSWWG